MNCKNCDTELEGKFCHNCGQSSKIERLNVVSALKDFAKTILHIERGGAYSISKLMTAPVKTIELYLKGGRVRHYRPLSLLIWVSAMNLLVQQYLSKYNNTNGLDITVESNSVVNVIFESPALMFMIALPFLALGFHIWIKKKNINYSEHIFIQIFTAIISGVVQIILSPILTICGMSIEYITVTIFFTGILVNFAIYVGLYSSFMSTGKALLITLASYISAFLILMIISTIVTLLLLQIQVSS